MANINSSAKRGASGKFESSRPSDERKVFVDPVAAGQAAGDPSEPGKPAASRRDAPGVGPAGGGTGKAAGKEKGASLDLSSAIGLIQGAHAIIGGLSRQGHWFLNDADAKAYGQAFANAARHFPLKATQKAIDCTTFVFVMGSMEIPRLHMSIQLARRPPAPARPPAQVFQFRPVPNAPPPPATSAQTAPQPAEGAGAQPPVAEGPFDYSSDPGAIGGEPAA